MESKTLNIVVGALFVLALPMAASAQTLGRNLNQEQTRTVKAQKLIGVVVNRTPDQLVVRTKDNRLMNFDITGRSLEGTNILPNEYVEVFYRPSAKTGEYDLVEILPQQRFARNTRSSGAAVLATRSGSRMNRAAANDQARSSAAGSARAMGAEEPSQPAPQPEQAQAPASSQRSAAQSQPSQLPHTASTLPLIGLIGLIASGGAVALRFGVKA